jgi:Glycosyl transferase 4-like domain
MLKILMLTTDQVIDRRILLEADALAADGCEVTILATPGAGPNHPRVVRVAADDPSGLGHKERAMLSFYRALRRWVSLNGVWGNRLKSFIWRHLISPDELARRLMLPSALSHRSHVIVAHDLPILPTAAEVAKHHGAKLVFDSHEFYCEQEFEPRVKRLWSAVERRHIGTCDAVITVNPSIARELMNRYKLSKVYVVQNAELTEGPPPANSKLFHKAFGLDRAAVVALFQGGVLAGRNLETLVDAMACIKTPGVHLVFLGDGVALHGLRSGTASDAAEEPLERARPG